MKSYGKGMLPSNTFAQMRPHPILDRFEIGSHLHDRREIEFPDEERLAEKSFLKIISNSRVPIYRVACQVDY